MRSSQQPHDFFLQRDPRLHLFRLHKDEVRLGPHPLASKQIFFSGWLPLWGGCLSLGACWAYLEAGSAKEKPKDEKPKEKAVDPAPKAQALVVEPVLAHPYDVVVCCGSCSQGGPCQYGRLVYDSYGGGYESGRKPLYKSERKAYKSGREPPKALGREPPKKKDLVTVDPPPPPPPPPNLPWSRTQALVVGKPPEATAVPTYSCGVVVCCGWFWKIMNFLNLFCQTWLSRS